VTDRENEVLETVNDILGTTYKTLEQVPDDKLKRVYIILKIIQILDRRPDLTHVLDSFPFSIHGGEK
jgi:hypothetical protein